MLESGLGFTHTIAFFIAIILVIVCGIAAGKRVKSSIEYEGASRNKGVFSCFGILVGTAMGGAGTIGSAQLGYSCGIAALWFTLGQCLANILLAVILTKPLRNGDSMTVNQIIGRKYSRKVGVVSGVIAAAGLLPSIVSQFSSSSILIGTCVGISGNLAAFAAMVLMILFVVSGGANSTSAIGRIKATVLGSGVLICGITAFVKSGFGSLLIETLPKDPYFDMFSRGGGRDLFNAIAVGIGLLAVQANQMAIISAKDEKTANSSLIACAVFLPLIGLSSCMVGMYMRCIYPDIIPSQSLILFIINYLPDWFGGIVIAILLVAILVTGSSCALGIETVLHRDILGKRINKEKLTRTSELLINRTLLTAILLFCFLMYVAGSSVTILDWSFVSSALRASFVFAPLMAAVYFDNVRIKESFLIAAMILGPAAVLLAYLVSSLGWLPIVCGLAVNSLLVFLGRETEKA